MAYTKTNWQTGDIIDASKLNHAEDGIAQAQQTADTANARDTLGEMSDVALSTPTNGQVLTYDSTSSKWKNAAASSGASTLASLTDTDISGFVFDGSILRYNRTAQKWRNTSLLLALDATEESGILYIDGSAESPGDYVNGISRYGMLVLKLYDAGGDLASVTPFTGAVYNQDGTITYKFGNITYTSDLNDDLMHRDT